MTGRRHQRLDTTAYDTDKEPSYLRFYEELFEDLRDRDVRLLELGVKSGGSLRLWRDYFPNGLIAGVDREPMALQDETGRIRFYQGSQEDTALLDRIGREVAPSGFDVVIDDAAHVASVARVSFWHLFEHHLRPGGTYVIEDWGTGYWASWPDGRAFEPGHGHGMVGFIKELVDECGAADITHPVHGLPPPRISRFAWVRIAFGLVAVRKP